MQDEHMDKIDFERIRIPIWTNVALGEAQKKGEKRTIQGTRQISAKCTGEWTWTRYLKWTRISHPGSVCTKSLKWRGWMKVAKSTDTFNNKSEKNELIEQKQKRLDSGKSEEIFENEQSMVTSNFWDRLKNTLELKFVNRCFIWIKQR